MLCAVKQQCDAERDRPRASALARLRCAWLAHSSSCRRMSRACLAHQCSGMLGRPRCLSRCPLSVGGTRRRIDSHYNRNAVTFVGPRSVQHCTGHESLTLWLGSCFQLFRGLPSVSRWHLYQSRWSLVFWAQACPFLPDPSELRVSLTPGTSESHLHCILPIYRS